MSCGLRVRQRECCGAPLRCALLHSQVYQNLVSRDTVVTMMKLFLCNTKSTKSQVGIRATSSVLYLQVRANAEVRRSIRADITKAVVGFSIAP